MNAINPITVFPNKTATQLNISAVYVYLGSRAEATCQLLDADGVQLWAGVVTIEGSDYAAWGTDDAYILNQVAAQLGVTLA